MRVWSHSDSHPASIHTHQPAPLAAGWLQNISQMKHGSLPNSLDSVPPAITERAIHHDGSKAAAQIVAAITKKKNKKMLLPPLQRLSSCQIAQASLLCALFTCSVPRGKAYGSDFGGNQWILCKSSSDALILQSQARRGTGKTPSCPGQSSYHHHYPMGARRALLHGSSSKKQEIMKVSDLQTFGQMGESSGRLWIMVTK